MKKAAGILICIVLCIPIVVFANSGHIVPRYAPTEGFTVHTDSPIEVKREDLLFDFSGNRDMDVIKAEVTAAYTMVNPTKEPQSVCMAFPFIGTLNDTGDGYVVLSDGQAVSCEAYIIARTGFTEDTQISYDFPSIVSRITDQPYEINYTEEEKDNKWTDDWLQMLVYTIDFPADSEKEVTVNYTGTGTINRPQGRKYPVYTFDYLLNPARYWSHFNDLNIKIITPAKAPYVIESSTPLTQEKRGVYTAFLEGLPEKDLYFCLYAHNRPGGEIVHDEVPQYRIRDTGVLKNGKSAFEFILSIVLGTFASLLIVVGLGLGLTWLLRKAKKIKKSVDG